MLIFLEVSYFYFLASGKVAVNFWKTHVGHDEEELRSKRLSASEKSVVVEKLRAGVPAERILEDARKLNKPTLERINLLNRNDVAYLSNKHNIENRRHNNEMIAAALKVQQWNEDGKNFAFFSSKRVICLFWIYLSLNHKKIHCMYTSPPDYLKKSPS